MNTTDEWKNNGVIKERQDGLRDNRAIYCGQGSHLIFNTFTLEISTGRLSSSLSKQIYFYIG